MMHRVSSTGLHTKWGGEHTGDGRDALSDVLEGGTGNASEGEASEGISSGDDAGAYRVGCLAMLWC